MTVLCRDCDLVVSPTRSQDWWKWRCLAEPIALAANFVDPPAVPTAPYQLCSKKNKDGECSDFRPIRKPSDEL